jgi:hypothetical protein
MGTARWRRGQSGHRGIRGAPVSGEISQSTITDGHAHAAAGQAVGHSGTGGAWGAVGLMVGGFTVAAVALPLQSWALEGVGLGIGAIGVIAAKLVGLMSQVH